MNTTQELPAWLSLFSSIFNRWKLYKNYQIRDKFVLLIREDISLALPLGIMKTKNREYIYSKAERKKYCKTDRHLTNHTMTKERRQQRKANRKSEIE